MVTTQDARSWSITVVANGTAHTRTFDHYPKTGEVDSFVKEVGGTTTPKVDPSVITDSCMWNTVPPTMASPRSGYLDLALDAAYRSIPLRKRIWAKVGMAWFELRGTWRRIRD